MKWTEKKTPWEEDYKFFRNLCKALLRVHREKVEAGDMKNNEEILKLGALLLRWHEAETKINPRSQGGEGVYRMEEADYEILTWAETRQLTHEKQ